MRIAIPVSGGRLAPHFGHAETFVFIDVDAGRKTILESTAEAAPPHAPGLLPPWLKERRVDVVLAGGMGARAQSLFGEARIEVLTGVASEEPQVLVQQLLDGVLATGPGVCDHHHGSGCRH